ncbi:MAG: LPP20 family lipoprotein [Endomicrobia bacterium]|nr:LPP20 family lipoprotein [Endomicrobiia bacterium]
MIKKIFTAFIFVCIPAFVFAADAPSWIKSGKSAKFPQDEYLTAVGQGSTEQEAAADASRNIVQNVTDMLASYGIEKAKINISPATLLRAFEVGHSYNDKGNNVFYVFGVVDRNMARINIEDDLFAAEQALRYRSAIFETTNFSIVPKIKAINELLELYDRRDSVVALKKALTGDVTNVEVGEFEREKLAIERKKLFENIVYYINAENFDAGKLKKFLDANGHSVLPELLSKPAGSDKGVVVVNCRIQINKIPDESKISYDWIADLVLNDAFNEKTVLYSKTSAGDESGKDDNEAASKAAASAEAEMNNMAKDFFMSINN